VSDWRLDAHLAILTTALAGYLRRLHVLWAASDDGGHDANVARLVGGVGARPTPTVGEIEDVSTLLAQADDGMLARITATFRLSPGEEALAAAAWWSEADPQLAIVLGCAHDDSARRYASAALLHRVLEPYGLEPPPALDDGSALVVNGVLEAGAGAAAALRLTPTARLLLAGGLPEALPVDGRVPPRLDAAREALARRLRSCEGGVVMLRGAAGIGRAAVAAAAAAAAGFVPVDGERPGAELRLLARAGVGLPIVDVATATGLRWRASDGPLVAIAAPGESVAGGYVVDLPAPRFDERLQLWEEALAAAPAADGLGPALATRFAFTERDVEQTLARARADALWHQHALSADGIWDAARRQPEHALERLAALVTPAFTIADLVLPSGPLAQLRELVSHVELQHVVLDDWGFRRRMPRGQGVIGLFTGPPGTGKTTAAEAVAHALRQDLYRVDLSAVVSKYIGETEKNLAAAFEEAERASAVLFFDEADSLFGKRTEVKDAHDRYANLEVNYLLQRVETFTGLVLLATNRQSALDEAFARRLRFVIRFEHPNHALRADLWRRSFPPETALDGLDWDELAQPELSGGSIQSAALAAAYLAAVDGTNVTHGHVEHALRREHEKLGRSFAGLFAEVES
jgi:ATPase family protein associated with various cellular activities (AAA)